MTTNRVNLRSFSFGGSAIAGAISATYAEQATVTQMQDADTGDVDVIATTGKFWEISVTCTKLPGLRVGDTGTPVLVGKSLDTDGSNGVGDGYQGGDTTMPTFGVGIVTGINNSLVIDGDVSYVVNIRAKMAA